MDNQQPSAENWRIVQEYNHYEVNEIGQIRHIKRKKVLSLRVSPNGYAYVNFNINGYRKNFAVHRIVAQAFLPNPNNYSEVNHKDYNKLNNTVSNLEWVSSSQNKKHMFLKEENKKVRGKSVEQYSLKGEYMKTFSSISEAAKEIGCAVSAISNCCSGRNKTSMGYYWKFCEGSTTKYERNPSSQREAPSYKEG